MIMKHSKCALIVAAAVIAVGTAALTGCDKVKEAAGNVRNVVTSMAEQVNNFDENIDADKLNDVLKNFYNGIKDGSINETTRGQYVTAELPKQNADAAALKAAAASATIFSALEDQGMTSHFTEEYLAKFVSVDGTIKALNAAVSEAGSYERLSYNMPISQALNLS